MKSMLLLAAILCLGATAAAADPEKPQNSAKPRYYNAIDYIQKTGKLWGIKELSIDAKGASVTLVDAQSKDYGYALSLLDSEGAAVEKAVLALSQFCYLSDGDHASVKLELKEIKDGVATFKVTDKFDKRSFGKGISQEDRILKVKPYKNEEEKAPEQPAK